MRVQVRDYPWEDDNILEKDLDFYVLPHPLIGKLTLREMLFFCIYHVQHHHKITQEIIRNSPTN